MKSESIGVGDPRVAEIMRQQEIKRQTRRERSFRLSNKKVPFDYPKLSKKEIKRLKIKNNMWANRRCFIIGGGPSLKNFDFSLLKNELVIGVNRAYEKIEPTIIFGADRQFFQWANEGKFGEESLKRWNETKALKIRLYIEGDGDVKGLEKLYKINCFGAHGLSNDVEAGIAYGGNSGYAAINLALLLGASPIYLLGYDMHPSGGWWHDGYPGKQGNIENFILEFQNIRDTKSEIINLNRRSNLKCFTFGDFPGTEVKHIKLNSKEDKITKRIKYDKDWVLVSYYTLDTSYEEEIKKLKKSIDGMEIDYCLFGKTVRGSWRANLDHKSAVILEALKMFPKKCIVFVDSDAIVNQYPKKFDELSLDQKANHIAAAFHLYKNSLSSGSLLSGTLWFNNSKNTHDLVRRWHEIGLKNPKIRHQHCLRLAIDEYHHSGKLLFVHRLPDSYTYIHDYVYKGKIDPVITHYQASRKLRDEVGQSIMLRDSNFTAVGGDYIK